ncbi:MAG: M48 family metallopeptidase [Oceanicaulis sp.]
MAERRSRFGFWRWIILLVLVGGGAAYWFANQQETPFTGRDQFVAIPPAQAERLGRDAYAEILASSRVVAAGPQVAEIKQIGARLAEAAAPEDPGYDWRFELIEDSSPNAFVLPGGYAAVHTGLLPVTQTEDGLAAVIGHEIGHALARHGSERLSQTQLMQIGAIGLGVVTGDMSAEAQRGLFQAFGIGSQVGVLLPYSREHEREADYIGLILMARACYDPRAAVGVWQRMAEAGVGGGPEILSTHPAPDSRIEYLEARMDEALAVRAAHCGAAQPA